MLPRLIPKQPDVPISHYYHCRIWWARIGGSLVCTMTLCRQLGKVSPDRNVRSRNCTIKDNLAYPEYTFVKYILSTQTYYTTTLLIRSIPNDTDQWLFICNNSPRVSNTHASLHGSYCAYWIPVSLQWLCKLNISDHCNYERASTFSRMVWRSS
jgi:hypothetical protein